MTIKGASVTARTMYGLKLIKSKQMRCTNYGYPREVKTQITVFAEKSDEDNGKSKDNNDDEGKDKQDEKVYSEEEFNKRVNDEMNRRLKQKEKEKQEAVDEAKRLAKMNKDQIAEYELEKFVKKTKN